MKSFIPVSINHFSSERLHQTQQQAERAGHMTLTEAGRRQRVNYKEEPSASWEQWPEFWSIRNITETRSGSDQKSPHTFTFSSVRLWSHFEDQPEKCDLCSSLQVSGKLWNMDITDRNPAARFWNKDDEFSLMENPVQDGGGGQETNKDLQNGPFTETPHISRWEGLCLCGSSTELLPGQGEPSPTAAGIGSSSSETQKGWSGPWRWMMKHPTVRRLKQTFSTGQSDIPV